MRNGFIDEKAMDNIGDIFQAIVIGVLVAIFLLNTGRCLQAIQVYKECLSFLNNEVLKKEEQLVNSFKIGIYRKIFRAYCLIPDYTNAINYGSKLLDNYRECGKTAEEGNLTLRLAHICDQQYRYAEAKELYKRAMNIMREMGDRKGEANAYGRFGAISYFLGDYDKAKEYLGKALAIRTELGDRTGEAADYENLGNVFQSLGEYEQAKEYLDKALAITIEIGERNEEASCYGNLGTVFTSLGEYNKAKDCLEKALTIRIEIGDRAGEATDYGNLGTVFHSLGEYDKAKEYIEKALAIKIEIGDRNDQAHCYGNLGAVFGSLGEYNKAKEHIEKALAIRIEIGSREGEATDYGNLGTVFHSLGEYDKAKEYLEKALTIRIETGDRAGEATDYGNLGTVLTSLGEYDKAKEYTEKALAIKIEIGDRNGEASCYVNLGTVLTSLSKYHKAKGYHEKALAIKIETGDRDGAACCYGNLGAVFKFLGEYDKAKEHIEKALAIRVEIGDRQGEATDYGNLGTVFQSLREYDKAKEHIEKALAMRIEIGDREGEATDYGNLGNVFHSLGEHIMAEDYFERATSIARDIGDLDKEIECLCLLTMVKLSQFKIQEAFDCLILGMSKCENLRRFLRDNDQFKILFSDVRHVTYRALSTFFCFSAKPIHALYVLELARARALADLMASQYDVNWQISADQQSWIGIENIMKKEIKCCCVYISYHEQHLFLWILKTSGAIYFRRITADENIVGAGLAESLDDFFAKSFRSLGILREEDCEDRSLNDIEPKPDSSLEKNLATLRQVKGKDDPELSLTLIYNMIIAPVADLLEGPEIIIIPEPCLYRVPFPALLDESGKYLSETFSIRIVPSLTTLKLIQDSPADYHSQTGALVVGDPDVGRVRYKGKKTRFSRLPCAGIEAAMIGRLLGVQPLLGQHATKQAVLERLHSVSLIHFAAHGNAERGEIALSPVRSPNRLPKEEDYLLTMSDIAQVQLRAKLVVLSCCHSGRGQIRAEGVVGIARAFLGSGARSVLVALWAINDSATEQLMSRFYEHLVLGESASESLHQAMKWMRGNDCSEVKQWAPFMLIGDNVTFDFGK